LQLNGEERVLQINRAFLRGYLAKRWENRALEWDVGALMQWHRFNPTWVFLMAYLSSNRRKRGKTRLEGPSRKEDHNRMKKLRRSCIGMLWRDFQIWREMKDEFHTRWRSSYPQKASRFMQRNSLSFSTILSSKTLILFANSKEQ